MKERKWVPYPRYIFRKEIALSLIRRYVPVGTRFLEIGCGAGDFGITLARLGYRGLMLDSSDEAGEQVRRGLSEWGVTSVHFEAKNFLDLNEPSQFDLITVFEVLEHIDDDVGALSRIRNLLCADGILVLSVPAKKKLWGADDVIVGHVRRYEREGLRSLLDDAGFEIIEFLCYGFPWLNGTRYVREKLAARALRRQQVSSRMARTKKSGVNPEGIAVPRLERLFRKYLLLPFIKISCLFNNTDLGEGYICLAKQRAARGICDPRRTEGAPAQRGRNTRMDG